MRIYRRDSRGSPRGRVDLLKMSEVGSAISQDTLMDCIPLLLKSLIRVFHPANLQTDFLFETCLIGKGTSFAISSPGLSTEIITGVIIAQA